MIEFAFSEGERRYFHYLPAFSQAISPLELQLLQQVAAAILLHRRFFPFLLLQLFPVADHSSSPFRLHLLFAEVIVNNLSSKNKRVWTLPFS